jgi:hypothetical protein
MRRLLTTAALVFVLAGCAGTGSVKNPVTSVDMFRVKQVYAATVDLAGQWRDYCWARSYKSLMADPIAKPICTDRRSRLRAIQAGDDKANGAIVYADNFVRNNPTLSITSVIGPAWDAVTKFQNLVPRIN